MVILTAGAAHVRPAPPSPFAGPVGPISERDLAYLHPATPQFIAPETDFTAIQAAIFGAYPKASKVFQINKVAVATDPTTPDGYDFVFGPADGATAASGFMGFTLLGDYDVGACAQLCNSRAPDADGGACQFFNIWQAIVNGTASEITCAFYFSPTNASTATNTGTPQLQVSQSRGYSRITFLPDGGFEDFTCTCATCNAPFYSTTSDATWTLVTTTNSTATASQILRLDGAHSGSVFATVGFFDSTNTGIWAPTSPIATVPGQNYVITLFHRLTNTLDTGSLATQFGVVWNGQVVLSPSPVDFDWHFYQVEVTAIGNDEVRFKDDLPNSQLPTSKIDDIFIFLA